MKIGESFKKGKPIISFEIFPPKAETSVEVIFETLDSLSELKPDFISVTYGAGGSSKDRTVEIATAVQERYGVTALAHLTSISSKKEEINAVLAELKKNGVENILALRGDLPQGSSPEQFLDRDFTYASDLMRHIKTQGDFSIGGACYPEGHQECRVFTDNIEHLKAKQEAGAEFLISQIFLDNEFYFVLKEEMLKKGVNIPVTAGIMPVLNKTQIERLTALCGCSIPPKFRRMMNRFADDPQAMHQAGIAYAIEQIIDLLASGVEGIHIYTMNRADITREITESITEIRELLTREK